MTLRSCVLIMFLAALNLPAADQPPPLIDPVSAMKQFQVPAGFKADLFAAEPQLLNPIAFSIDEQGRVYVAETFRYRKSTYDIRSHMDMYADDIACRTVDDRLAMIQKHLGTNWQSLTNEAERIRLLEDRDGDGRAEYSSAFADGFNTVLDGLGAGILARNGSVYYTDIPNLWVMQDHHATGHAEALTSLGYGYGVHFSLTGHDMHGLRFGPDGRLYFSIGDRGLCVTNREGRVLSYPDTGCVLRCNPDGSELEVFASGLRNPQSLAFNDHGDLFSGDNNGDSGDAARLVYIVEGGDGGWRTGNQISETTPAGVWNSEQLWHLHFPGQAAYIVPPIAHIAQGPAGFNHFPGTGFPDRLRDHFLLCDYKSASPNSGIHSFAVEPDGAGYKMVDHDKFIWSILATDIEFSPDGRLFVSDWVAHWPLTNKGRLYRFYQPELVASALAQETKRLINEGMKPRSLPELGRLLGHADQRVRQEAQFELAGRALADAAKLPEVAAVLQEAARHATNQLGRLHALWGLGQIGRSRAALSHQLEPVIPLLNDPDAEVRAQTAKVLGEARVAAAVPGLINALKDANLRVRFFAASSLGKLKDARAVEGLLAVLRENADRDPFLRHAAIMGLAGSADVAALTAAARDASASARMGVLLAMRRRQLPEVAQFLQDTEPSLVIEAARAINDVPIPAAQPQLAALIARPTTNAMLDWRAVNANFRLGGEANAAALAKYAVQRGAPERARAEALHALETWAQPAPRDRITGLVHPLPARDPRAAVQALAPVLDGLLQRSPNPVRIAAIHAAEGLSLPTPALYNLVTNKKLSGNVRAAALAALEKFKDQRLLELVKLAVADSNAVVRAEGSRALARIDPGEAAESFELILDHGTLAERQNVFGILGRLQSDAARKILSRWMDALLAGKVAPDVQFDLLEAARQCGGQGLQRQLTAYLSTQSPDDEFNGYRETLQGGNAEAGHKVFLENQQAGCITCHKVKGRGGDVGPELTGIIRRHDRGYILESILYPSKQIAPGFENVVIKTRDGQTYAGIVKQEDAAQLTLNVPDEGTIQIVTLKKPDIVSRVSGPSGMPAGLGSILTKREIRDLVEFLSSTK